MLRDAGWFGLEKDNLDFLLLCLLFGSKLGIGLAGTRLALPPLRFSGAEVLVSRTSDLHSTFCLLLVADGRQPKMSSRYSDGVRGRAVS